MIRILPVALLIASLAVSLFGCGEDDPGRPTVFVHVTPAQDTLEVGAVARFSAVVLGTRNLDVTWDVPGGEAHGTVDRTGLYTAPPARPDPPLVSVRATSVADTTKSAEASILVLVPEGIGVEVEPVAARIHVGHSQRFRAWVSGTDAEEVAWSVDEGSASGTIDALGVYTAPAAVPDPPVATVRATSLADPAASATALVTVYEAGRTPTGFVRVPAGSYDMGDGVVPCGDELFPITLTRDFYLGQREVTVEEYREMLQWAYDNGHVVATLAYAWDAMGSQRILLPMRSSGIEFRGGGTFLLYDQGNGIDPNRPVHGVTWYGAASYCDWLSLREGLPPAYDHVTWRCNDRDPYGADGYRLPTDVEWEYAAQYDDERIYPWGDFEPNSFAANYAQNEHGTVPVGSYVAEKTIDGRGLYDMAGNVWEWCNDWYECYPDLDHTDPSGPPTGVRRVSRGGGWTSLPASLRCAVRFSVDPGSSQNDRGFRIARTVIP